MNSSILRGWPVVVLLLGTALTGSASAQSPQRNGGEERGELRQAMRQYYENRIRADLALSDGQMEQILPHIHGMEESRAAIQGERREAVQELRRGLDQGADDAALQELLDVLDGLDLRMKALEREYVALVDAVLTVRQRVEFRFFSERFRRDMRKRIETATEGRSPRDRDQRRRRSTVGDDQ